MRRHLAGPLASVAAALLCFLAIAPCALAQHISGKIDVTVVDPTGAVVPGAKLTLQDLSTNETREAVTQSTGTYTFVNLNVGNYKLTVSKDGFQTQEFNPVTVASTKTTAVDASLKLGQAAQSVVVEGGAAPVLEATTNSLGSVVDLKQIEDLPLSGRDLTQLTRLVPGYNGTWNGLPSIAQGNNVDGVVGSPQRMKFGGNYQPSVSVRLENIEEMTVQTDELDMNQGFGQSAMQVNFVTRRGTNQFHGRFFEDHRNSALNANSWVNDANMSINKLTKSNKAHFILNDFGGSIGGPIIKDKLFFFASLSTSRQPGSVTATNTMLTPAAQQGNFSYFDGAGNLQTVNVLQVANAYDPTLPNTVNSIIGTNLSAINQAAGLASVVPSSDPIVSNLTWNTPGARTYWYPTFRVDYNFSQAWRTNLAVNRTKQTIGSGGRTPLFPGSAFAGSGSSSKFDNFTVSWGLDTTISPTVINQLKAGYLYYHQNFGPDASKGYITNPTSVSWPIVGSPQDWYLPVSTFYPVFNVSDTVNWQRGSHSFGFGLSFYREQDHYWNPPEGISAYSLGLVNGDPALDALTNAGAYQPLPGANADQQAEAQDLYALLTGRVNGVSGRYKYDPATKQYKQEVGAYNLDELTQALGLFMQDSWRLRPTLTINYGLRWDFTGDNHDLTGAYHNASLASIYGPSGVGNLFKPGSLQGTSTPTLDARPHAYNSWKKGIQPAIGFAWNPSFNGGILKRLAGGQGGTVIRGGFSLRKFTVPNQYFWNNASDYGSFFYQFFSLNPTTAPGAPGTFYPGSISLGQTLPPFNLSPPAYQTSEPVSDFTFQAGTPVYGMKYNIGQPYTESWNLGIQRSIGTGGVLELRYNGNRTLKQWINLNINEVNVFENGFLQEFQNAQKNLAINAANGVKSFANLNPGAGTVPVPILTAAFTGSQTGSQTDANFARGAFINDLNTGQVGAMANTLGAQAASAPYLCNLIGSTNFSPCAGMVSGPNQVNGSGPGAGYPINFFQANPYAAGTGTDNPGCDGCAGYMTDAGYSSYNALQVDFRQRAWHGVTLDANYTWSHTLGVSTPNDWTGAYPQFTLRDLRMSYAPTLFDLRHVVHVNTTVDLPFGTGRAFLNRPGVVDKVFGGWTVGTIVTYQTGYPFRVLGGYNTFNNFGDSGVVLNGVSKQQLQNAVGVYPIPDKAFVSMINPKYLKGPTGGGANPAFITANTTPGTIAPPLYLYGPHGFYDDISIAKQIPITERWRFTFQTELLNAFNHPVFGQRTTPVGSNIRSNGWFTGTPTNSSQGGDSRFGRQIEFRANISF